MEQKIGALVCSQCDRKIRPPFKICTSQHLVCPHCQKHFVNGDEEPEPYYIDCTSEETIFTTVNAIFINIMDYCQFECGYMGPLLELQNHESSCIKQKSNIKCPVKDCGWNGTVNNLISHFDNSHNDQLIIHSTLVDQHFPISLRNQIYLVIMFDKNYFCNELYWIRLLEGDSKRYVMVQYQGRIGKFIEPAQKWDTFKITFVENPNYIVVGNICFSSNDRNKQIIDDEVVKLNGVSIDFFKGDNIAIEFSDKMIPVCPGFMMADLECNVCTEMMSEPIRICSTGHSMCTDCAFKLTECSLCQSAITQGRNFTLEQIAGRVSSSCPFKSNGCMFKFPYSKRDNHIKQCLFRPIKECIFECYDLCDFDGIYKDLETHWKSEHGLIYENAVTYLQDLPLDSSPEIHLFSAFDENFVFVKESTPAYFMFSLTHVTHEYSSSFHYDIKLSNPATGHFERFCLPFATSLNGIMQHQIPNDILYNIICDNKKYNVTVNIFKNN